MAFTAVQEPSIIVRNLSKTFSKDLFPSSFVLENVHVSINRGSFYVLLGPSGCGKSTLLHLLAGFTQKTSGEFVLRGDTEGASASLGFVFQSAESALFPWLTVHENIEFGLKMKKIPREQRNQLSSRFIQIAGLAGHENKFPKEISGGMKQRVQLARVLVNDPDILLMDEPFGALDAMTRRTMQQELIRIWQETNKTVVFVTHDIQEAITLGQQIGIMSVGPSSQIVSTYDISLPYPRENTSPSFNHYYKTIQAHFE